MAAVLLACSPTPTSPENAALWTVVKVYDGDTLLASGPDEDVVVRLVGIDAPERGKAPGEPSQPFSRKARDYLAARVKNRTVTIVDWGEDRYGRRLGEILLDGVNVNREMVAKGLAEVYGGRTPEGFDRGPYRSEEAAAQKASRGIWSQGRRYVSPLDWKHPRR